MKNTNWITILFLFILGCGNKPQIKDPIPTHDSFTIDSKQVEETRIINVWTPPSYKNNDNSFPVLYMPDGGLKEDFPHIANTLAKLIKEKSIPPIILVGIENTIRGRDLTGFSETKQDEKYCPLTDGASNFRNFITQELFLEIDKRYRVTNKKGIIGESLAGLFVIETFLQKPKSFDFYIAFDPSLWWNNHFLSRKARHLLDKFPDKDLKLWFAGSSAEDISKYTNELAKSLNRKNPNRLKWRYADEPKEKHNTIFRATKEKAIIWALND